MKNTNPYSSQPGGFGLGSLCSKIGFKTVLRVCSILVVLKIMFWVPSGIFTPTKPTSRIVMPVLSSVTVGSGHFNNSALVTGYYAVLGSRNAAKIATRTKVFGLGLSRTGTTSMANALDMLGYKTIHADSTLGHFMHHADQTPILNGVYDAVDSVWNIPTAAYYKELHKAYPDAKFILTIRSSTQQWYASVEKYQREYLHYYWGCVVPERVQRLHEFVYGTRYVDPSWMTAYDRHNQEVQDYFKDYPNQLLVINMEDDNVNHFQKICSFLNSKEGPCALKEYPTFPKLFTFQQKISAAPVEKQCPGPKQGYAKYAYVFQLCDPANDKNNNYLRAAIVAAESIRKYDNVNDFVMLIYGAVTQTQLAFLGNFFQQVITGQAIGGGRVEIPDPRWDRKFPAKRFPCHIFKVHAFELSEYDKIMYVDTDMFLKSDPSYLFQHPGFIGGDGGLVAPLGTNFFVGPPSQQAYADMNDIVMSGSFEGKDGWLGYGDVPDWNYPGTNIMHNWTFLVSHIDQGVFYYYFYSLLGIGEIKERYELIAHRHFGGPTKPWRQDKNNLDEDAPVWFEAWNNITKRVNVEGFELKGRM